MLEVRIPVTREVDIVTARQLALTLGFTSGEAALVATAISELARNIVLYAKRGEIVAAPAVGNPSRGLIITAKDEGGGIADVGLALQEGYSTGGGLGVGLPG